MRTYPCHWSWKRTQRRNESTAETGLPRLRSTKQWKRRFGVAPSLRPAPASTGLRYPIPNMALQTPQVGQHDRRTRGSHLRGRGAVEAERSGDACGIDDGGVHAGARPEVRRRFVASAGAQRDGGAGGGVRGPGRWKRGERGAGLRCWFTEVLLLFCAQ